MLCYLLIQLADAFEVEATKPSTEVIVSGKVLIVMTLRRMKIVQIITLVQCRIFSLLLINIQDYMTVHCNVSSDVEKAAIYVNTVVARDRNLIYTVCAI